MLPICLSVFLPVHRRPRFGERVATSLVTDSCLSKCFKGYYTTIPCFINPFHSRTCHVRDLPRYEAFVKDWHDFKKSAEKAGTILTERSRDSVARYILQIFFVHPYLTDKDFYPQYDARMDVCREALGQILLRLFHRHTFRGHK